MVLIDVPFLNALLLLGVIALGGIVSGGLVSRNSFNGVPRFVVGIMVGLLVFPFLFYFGGKVLNAKLDIPFFLVVVLVVSIVSFFVQKGNFFGGKNGKKI